MTAFKDHRPWCHINYSWKEAARLHAHHPAYAASWGRGLGGRDTTIEATGKQVVAYEVRENPLPEAGRQISQPLLQGLRASTGAQRWRQRLTGVVALGK